MTLAERVKTLEADNDRLRTEQARLFAVLDRLAAAVELLAGAGPAPAEEPAARPPCRVPRPARRSRRPWGDAT